MQGAPERRRRGRPAIAGIRPRRRAHDPRQPGASRSASGSPPRAAPLEPRSACSGSPQRGARQYTPVRRAASLICQLSTTQQMGRAVVFHRSAASLSCASMHHVPVSAAASTRNSPSIPARCAGRPATPGGSRLGLLDLCLCSATECRPRASTRNSPSIPARCAGRPATPGGSRR
jgi:hypothetical protein